MNKYHLFLDGSEALCIEADGWTQRNDWMGFYLIDGVGQETTFPPTWKRLLLRAKPKRQRVEIREHFHWVRHNLIKRLVVIADPSSQEQSP